MLLVLSASLGSVCHGLEQQSTVKGAGGESSVIIVSDSDSPKAGTSLPASESSHQVPLSPLSPGDYYILGRRVLQHEEKSPAISERRSGNFVPGVDREGRSETLKKLSGLPAVGGILAAAAGAGFGLYQGLNSARSFAQPERFGTFIQDQIGKVLEFMSPSSSEFPVFDPESIASSAEKRSDNGGNDFNYWYSQTQARPPLPVPGRDKRYPSRVANGRLSGSGYLSLRRPSPFNPSHQPRHVIGANTNPKNKRSPSLLGESRFKQRLPSGYAPKATDYWVPEWRRKAIKPRSSSKTKRGASNSVEVITIGGDSGESIFLTSSSYKKKKKKPKDRKYKHSSYKGSSSSGGYGSHFGQYPVFDAGSGEFSLGGPDLYIPEVKAYHKPSYSSYKAKAAPTQNSESGEDNGKGYKKAAPKANGYKGNGNGNGRDNSNSQESSNENGNGNGHNGKKSSNGNGNKGDDNSDSGEQRAPSHHYGASKYMKGLKYLGHLGGLTNGDDSRENGNDNGNSGENGNGNGNSDENGNGNGGGDSGENGGSGTPPVVFNGPNLGFNFEGGNPGVSSFGHYGHAGSYGVGTGKSPQSPMLYFYFFPENSGENVKQMIRDQAKHLLKPHPPNKGSSSGSGEGNDDDNNDDKDDNRKGVSQGSDGSSEGGNEPQFGGYYVPPPPPPRRKSKYGRSKGKGASKDESDSQESGSGADKHPVLYFVPQPPKHYHGKKSHRPAVDTQSGSSEENTKTSITTEFSWSIPGSKSQDDSDSKEDHNKGSYSVPDTRSRPSNGKSNTKQDDSDSNEQGPPPKPPVFVQLDPNNGAYRIVPIEDSQESGSGNIRDSNSYAQPVAQQGQSQQLPPVINSYNAYYTTIPPVQPQQSGSYYPFFPPGPPVRTQEQAKDNSGEQQQPLQPQQGYQAPQQTYQQPYAPQNYAPPPPPPPTQPPRIVYKPPLPPPVPINPGPEDTQQSESQERTDFQPKPIPLPNRRPLRKQKVPYRAPVTPDPNRARRPPKGYYKYDIAGAPQRLPGQSWPPPDDSASREQDRWRPPKAQVYRDFKQDPLSTVHQIIDASNSEEQARGQSHLIKNFGPTNPRQNDYRYGEPVRVTPGYGDFGGGADSGESSSARLKTHRPRSTTLNFQNALTTATPVLTEVPVWGGYPLPVELPSPGPTQSYNTVHSHQSSFEEYSRSPMHSRPSTASLEKFTSDDAKSVETRSEEQIREAYDQFTRGKDLNGDQNKVVHLQKVEQDGFSYTTFVDHSKNRRTLVGVNSGESIQPAASEGLVEVHVVTSKSVDVADANAS